MLSPPVVLFLSDSIFEDPYSWKSHIAYRSAQGAICPFLKAVDEKDMLVTKCASFEYKISEANDSYVFEMWLGSHNPGNGFWNIENTSPRVFKHVYEKVLTHSALLLESGHVAVDLVDNNATIYIRFDPHVFCESEYGPH